MRVAVASDDGVFIARHFGRCVGFIVFDIAGGVAARVEHRMNAGGHHQNQEDCREGGHEHSAHSHESFVIALKDCEAVICRGMGRRAVADLSANGISPAIVTEEITAQVAADLYARGRLSSSTDSTCCSH
ncbi:iron-molybdenum cofactor biosynthesis protein [candidate division GN15 bacterium]|uniref:Iron-molybdenum cofactor biosynthesis protein n=1 Tax=candidate division GN15 bacterium TaxID=2072418 RepID=A0A855X2X5_9BACT|nr:MAG: iron-molybdenum cofactor biosynthesis protein [candidate division GN15 bacterium]